MRAAAVRAALARHGLRPNRELGQNFLIDAARAERLVELAGVEPGDTVIEIGAGLGVLTRALAARARRVVSLEIDAGLVRLLREEGDLPDHVELLHADVLELDLAVLARAQGGRVRVVANLPYSVASPILRRLLDACRQLADWSVLLQREVAVRLTARAGSRAYGSLAVLHHLAAMLERRAVLSSGCFYPAPRVVSVFLRITPRSDSPLASGELERVERVVRAAFGQRRKLLVNALQGGGVGPPRPELEVLLAHSSIAARARAESVTPEAFLVLTRALTAGRA